MKKYFFAVFLLMVSGISYGQQSYPRDIALSWVNASQYQLSLRLVKGLLNLKISQERFQSREHIGARGFQLLSGIYILMQAIRLSRNL